jgi:hypothetical protein
MLRILHSRVNVINFRVLLLPLLLGLSFTAFAQVYKSTDAEGNVTFSDTPATGSEAVQVEETNVADPTKVPENTTPTPAPEPKVSKQEAPPEGVISADDDNDDKYIRPRGARRAVHHHHRRHHRRR